MGNFNRDNRFSRGSDRGGRRDFGRHDSGRRDFGRPEMHKAVCSKCRKDCEVPFRPTGSKPVFCRDCFKSNDNFNDRPKQPNYRDQFESLNAKLDRILKILTPVAAPVEAVVEHAELAEETVAPKKKVKKPKKSPQEQEKI